MEITLGRVYDPPAADGRTRVLVDRLWPRGMRKESAPFDLWMKEVAPSAELRTWYHAHPDAVDEFARRYRQELQRETSRQALARLRSLAETGGVVLLTATREVRLSQAPILRAVLLETTGREADPGPVDGR